MKIEGPLIPAIFVERPNRFITMIKIDNEIHRSHLPDPGRLQELLFPGANLLARAAPKNSSRKTKYSTWLGNYAKFTCLNYVNSKKYIFNADTEQLHEFIEESQFAPDHTDTLSEEFKILLSTMDGLKDCRIKKIFQMRYFYDKKKEGTWKNISENLNMSIQTAINLHKKGLGLLKNRLKGKISIDRFPEQ